RGAPDRVAHDLWVAAGAAGGGVERADDGVPRRLDHRPAGEVILGDAGGDDVGVEDDVAALVEHDGNSDVAAEAQAAAADAPDGVEPADYAAVLVEPAGRQIIDRLCHTRGETDQRPV